MFGGHQKQEQTPRVARAIVGFITMVLKKLKTQITDGSLMEAPGPLRVLK